MKIFFKKNGQTLVEVAIGAVIAAIATGGLLMASLHAKYFAEQAMLKTLANSYAQELVEYITRLNYTNDSTYIAPVGGDHDFATYNAAHPFNSTTSGILEDDGATITPLSETAIGYKTPIYGFSAAATSLNPIDTSPSGVTTNPDYSYNFLGFETLDIDAINGGIDGTCQIQRCQYDMHLVGGAVAKYFFADDVDDFNGYSETISDVIPGISMTLRVAVQGITEDHTISGTPSATTYTLSVPAFSDVGPLTRQRMMTGVTISGVTWSPPSPVCSTTSDADKFCQHIEQSHLVLKKITIVAEWTYPPGTGGKIYKEVYYAAKSNTNVSIL